MTAPHNANDLLFGGGGAPALQWANPDTRQDFPVGTSYEGEIVRHDARLQRDINDRSKIATWADGSKKYVAIVTLQTDLRDPDVEEDDGQRSLWISGKYLQNAVKAAVRKTGAREFEEGGWLKVTLVGYGKPEGGYRPPRLFEAVYRKPSPERQAENARRAQQAQQQAHGDPSDPWAQQQAPDGFLPSGQTANPDPWGVEPARPVQPQPVDFGAMAPAQPGQPAQTAVQNYPTAPPQQVDTSGMDPKTAALVHQMLTQQQGGTQ